MAYTPVLEAHIIQAVIVGMVQVAVAPLALAGGVAAVEEVFPEAELRVVGECTAYYFYI
jgi:hypothetical protein